MNRGLFISVEGIDGAGKSTHLEFIHNYLKDRGIEVVITREPGGTVIGEKIRELLLNVHAVPAMHGMSELLLYFASRQELIAQVILPHLEQGTWVIADRFVDASIAYQGGGRNLGADKVKQLYQMLEPTVNTDITFLFDVELDVAMQRVTAKGQRDRIEQESRQFFSRVRQTYLNLANENSERIKIINTAETIAQNQAQLASYLDQLLNKG